MSVSKRIIRRRCDVPMRKRKEECLDQYYRPWRCPKDCKNCFCCIETDRSGGDSHVDLRFAGVKYDEFKEEGE